MMAEDRKRTRIVAAAVLTVILVLAVAACSPQGGSKETAHTGSVDAQTQRQVVDALQKAGVQPEGTGENLLMRWDPNKPNAVIVTGYFAPRGATASSQAVSGAYEAQKQPDGSWTVRPRP